MYKFDIPESVIFFSETENLISRLIQILKDNASESPLFICGENSYRELGEAVFKAVKAVFTDAELIISPEINKELDCDSKSAVVAIGGGKILDFAKYLAFKSACPLLSIPSNAAHDGIFSPISVIAGQSLGTKMPDYLLIPLNILRSSPLSSTQAGIGDLIANFTAIYDSCISRAVQGEEVDEESLMMAFTASKAIVDMIYEYSNNGMKPETLFHCDVFMKQFVTSLVLSGLAMYKAKSSRPCSGSEHMISHAIDKIYGHAVKAAHGIQVAVASNFIIERQLEKLRELGTMSVSLREQIDSDLQKFSIDFSIDELLAILSMPRTFSEIGIKEDEIPMILELAPRTRPGKFSILDFRQENIRVI